MIINNKEKESREKKERWKCVECIQNRKECTQFSFPYLTNMKHLNLCLNFLFSLFKLPPIIVPH